VTVLSNGALIIQRDITDEFSTLPTSAITSYRSGIMYPSSLHEVHVIGEARLDVPHLMLIYSNLIHLHSVLDEAHKTLYSCKASERQSVIAH
jgi:hypothetical protein